MTELALSLPEANEFSPGQIDLRRVLEICSQHDGDRAGMVEALRLEYFSESAPTQEDPARRLEVQRTRGSNVTVGMRAYGLLDTTAWTLTPLGLGLLVAPDDVLMQMFAADILRNRHGSKVLEAVMAIQSRGERPTKGSLARELTAMGFALPRATTHHTKLLQWLREAAVLDADYRIDETAVQELTGVAPNDLRAVAGLTVEQRAFLRTLRRMSEVTGANPVSARDVVDQAIQEFGPVFQEDQLRSKVFKPLEEAGLVVLSGTGSGRGGKSGLIAPTPALLAFADELLQAVGGIPAELRVRLNTPIEQILSDLESTDTHVSGIALELLAIRMSFDLTLTPTKFRERSSSTGGAEVDLISEAAHLHFSRWLFQCKNTTTVGVADLAKEVGMAVMLRAQVIVMVTTGRFAGSLGDYVKTLGETSAMQAVLVDRGALANYRSGGRRALLTYFRRTAETTLKLKRGQVP